MECDTTDSDEAANTGEKFLVAIEELEETITDEVEHKLLSELVRLMEYHSNQLDNEICELEQVLQDQKEVKSTRNNNIT